MGEGADRKKLTFERERDRERERERERDFFLRKVNWPWWLGGRALTS